MKKGDKVIDFNTEDIYGSTVSLKDFSGQKILLSFLRTAACPFCNLRVHEMELKQQKWKSEGLVTIAVFASPGEEILKYAGKQKPSFSVLPDPDEELYKLYNIGHSLAGKFKAMRRVGAMVQIMRKGLFNLKSLADKSILTGDFLIDENGIIDQAYYGKDFGDHISFVAIDNWLKEPAGETSYVK